ncbi:hypothetical protein RFI_10718 [Reticulomyxa filosa]|uniref:Activator of Hsp90 ATPase AHSA1-like N-terminal domain-containing protein n=1 Tax=Reticulomyxa filosa TaxID=46433 RepID=X6NL46_RETFI|nr:hypothetical protein RFI_10718 [Reticulomyxa filosa]|eukprot:ETO26419.1 hypothetical protein RFI_10718 [Reticulomyxa filosa]
MFNPLGGFHFKPSEEELAIRQKLEEERKKQAGVTEEKKKHSSKSKSNSNSNSEASSTNASDEKKPETKKANGSTTVKTDTKSKTDTNSNSDSNTNSNTNNTDTSKGKSENKRQRYLFESILCELFSSFCVIRNSAKPKYKYIQSKTETSSYYFFKSTDPEKAKEFKPKPIDEETAKQKEQQTASKTVASLWNTGSTMEEYDYSDWVHQRLKQELVKVDLAFLFYLNIFLKKKIEFRIFVKIFLIKKKKATFLFARGKLRAGWDLNLKAKWKGVVDGKEVEGTISMEDIVDSEDSDDWLFEVSAKELRTSLLFFIFLKKILSQKEFDKGRRLIISQKKKVLDVIDRVLAEFKSKKTSK